MIAAMDVGGTHIRCRIFDVRGDVVATEQMRTRETGLIEAIERIVEKYGVRRVGISFAGQVHEGVILSAPNIRVDEPKIQAYFMQKHGIELRIENDLKCAALAEYDDWGCETTLVAASIGTGFGSGIIERGRLFRGVKNLAGEIGHAPYKYSEIPCGCGNHYCIEASCSGSALQRWIEHYRLPVGENILHDLKEMDDPRARQILENFHEGMLFAVGSLISIVNPELLVLGGGVVQKNPYLVEMVRERIGAYALPASVEEAKIVMSRLDDAPLRGAELLVRG